MDEFQLSCMMLGQNTSEWQLFAENTTPAHHNKTATAIAFYILTYFLPWGNQKSKIFEKIYFILPSYFDSVR